MAMSFENYFASFAKVPDTKTDKLTSKVEVVFVLRENVLSHFISSFFQFSDPSSDNGAPFSILGSN